MLIQFGFHPQGYEIDTDTRDITPEEIERWETDILDPLRCSLSYALLP